MLLYLGDRLAQSMVARVRDTPVTVSLEVCATASRRSEKVARMVHEEE